MKWNWTIDVFLGTYARFMYIPLAFYCAYDDNKIDVSNNNKIKLEFPYFHFIIFFSFLENFDFIKCKQFLNNRICQINEFNTTSIKINMRTLYCTLCVIVSARHRLPAIVLHIFLLSAMNVRKNIESFAGVVAFADGRLLIAASCRRTQSSNVGRKMGRVMRYIQAHFSLSTSKVQRTVTSNFDFSWNVCIEIVLRARWLTDWLTDWRDTYAEYDTAKIAHCLTIAVRWLHSVTFTFSLTMFVVQYKIM